MGRFVVLFVVLTLLAAACGGGADVAAPTPSDSVVTAQAVPDQATESTTSNLSAPDETVEAVTGDRAPSGVDGPAAPDFSLLLSDGSTFTLSEETKPVYMVFWAEW